MTLLVEKGTFTKTTSTSTPVSQQVTLSNGSLTPKLIILWTTGQTTTDGSYADDTAICYGYSDTANDACVSSVGDESARGEWYCFRNDSIICIMSVSSATAISQADVSAVAAGSFTLNWSVQSDTSAMSIHYMVAGGTDITNVSVFNTTVGSTTTGNKSYNGSGTTFTPDFALMMCSGDTVTTANSIVNSLDQNTLVFGAAKSTSKRWVIAKREETVGTSDTNQYINGSACLFAGSNTSGAITFLADFVSFNSAAGGGITINVTDGSADAGKLLSFLLIKGGTWDCGAFQQRSGTGTQDVTTATSLASKLAFIAGINSATSGSVQVNAYLGMGGSDGTNEGCSYVGNTAALATWTAVRANSNSKVYRTATPAATASSSTTNAECDMSSMATPGQFTLNWTTADSTLRQMAYWTLGSVGNAITKSLATETVSISESPAVAILRNKIRTRSETVTISETPSRLAAKLRPLATQTTTISEVSLVRIKGKVKSLATETITVTGGTLAILRNKIRTASDTVTKGESIARLSTKNRALATQTVTVTGGTLARLKASMKALATQTVSISESATRLAAKIRALATQTVSISENSARLKGAMRIIATQTVTIAEDVQRLVGIGAKNVTRALATETVALSESLTRLLTKSRAIPQSVPTSENVARLKSVYRILPQTVAIAEQLARIKSAIKSLALQSVSTSESMGRLTAKIRTLSQSVASAESVVIEKTGEIVRAITETVNISEALVRLTTKQRSIAQTTAISESVAKVKAKTKALATETIAISENIARLLTKQRIITETLTIIETVTRPTSKMRSLAPESLVVADILVRDVNQIIKHIVRTITETVSIIESPLLMVVDKWRLKHRRIVDPSNKKIRANHPAYLLGSKGMHDGYIEF